MGIVAHHSASQQAIRLLAQVDYIKLFTVTIVLSDCAGSTFGVLVHVQPLAESPTAALLVGP